MYVDDLRVTDYTSSPLKSYSVSINSYHIHVSHGDDLVYSRTPDMYEWLDGKHRRITLALEALEKAILEAVNR